MVQPTEEPSGQPTTSIGDEGPQESKEPRVQRLEEYVWASALRYPRVVGLEIPPADLHTPAVTLTYAELYEESTLLSEGIINSLPHLMRLDEVDPRGSAQSLEPLSDSIVILTLPRTQIDAYLCLLATLNAGAAYCVIDAQFPPKRARQIIQDAEPILLICEESRRAEWERLTEGDVSICTPADLRGASLRGVTPLKRSERALPPSSGTLNTSRPISALAYLIYTSGSTGTPKGVMIEHQNIAHLIEDDLRVFNLGPQDRLLQGSAHAYDSSVEEMFMAWSAGATVVVGDDEVMRLGPDLAAWLHAREISVITPPPTLLRTLGGHDVSRSLTHLRLIYVGGEALPRDVAEVWAEGRFLVNGYGPTECSVTATRAWISSHEEEITIGSPHPGLRALIVNERLEPLPPGEEGELLLSGPALARGYLRRPALSAERFPTLPELGRVYRTGDLVSLNERGLIRFHGRIDAQVKLRGYRLELTEVEAHIASLTELIEVACVVVERSVGQKLIALYTRDFPADHDALLTQLAERVPHYMIPSRMIHLDQMPRLMSEKIDRRALQRIAIERESYREADQEGREHTVAEFQGPKQLSELLTALSDDGGSPEQRASSLSLLIATIIEVEPEHVTPDLDFFRAGGDSISAAVLISHLRCCPPLSCLAVRDVYELRTARALTEAAVKRTSPLELTEAKPEEALYQEFNLGPSSSPPQERLSSGEPVASPVSTLTLSAVTMTQGLLISIGWLSGLVTVAYLFLTLASLLLSLPTGYLELLLILSWLFSGMWWPIRLAVALPIVKLAKLILIGKYRPMTTPVWGGYYLRHWIMATWARLIPWRALEGSPLQAWVLRQLGAKVGRDVYLHRGVILSGGGWDLIEIGDGVTIGRDVSIRPIEYERLTMRLDRVVIDSGATLETRSGVSAGGRVGSGSILSPHSVARPSEPIPPLTYWRGALGEDQRPVDEIEWSRAQRAASLDEDPMSPLGYILRSYRAQCLTTLLIYLPSLLVGLGAITWGRQQAGLSLLEVVSRPTEALGGWVQALTVLSALVMILWIVQLGYLALLCRWRGRVPLGVHPVYGSAMIRAWQKERLLMIASQQLSGTLFWPRWLRLAGMRVGPDSEISTIMECVPEHLDIEGRCFSADGIYLGAPRLDQGRIRFDMTRFERDIFLGNHAVIPAGTHLQTGTLLGVCTVSDQPSHPQSAWFGNPTFELPRREVIEVDQALTHRPSRIRYLNRWLWEFGRVGIPVLFTVELCVWLTLIPSLSQPESPWFETFKRPMWVDMGQVSGWLAILALFNLCLILVMKWSLIGRAQAGQHPLWSCWCSRWDSLYVYWGALARPILKPLEGTLWLNPILRLFGVKIGRRVFLGSGFAQVVDPDMLRFDDEVTVVNLFQAHSFEDRVLKLAQVHFKRGSSVGAETVVLYGAEVGESTTVLEHSVIMKREILPAHQKHGGMPTQIAPLSRQVTGDDER